MTIFRIIRQIGWVGAALSLACASGGGMVTAAVSSAMVANHNGDRKIPTTGDRRHEVEWMQRNDAELEVNDSYWQHANTRVKEMLTKKTPAPNTARLFGGNPRERIIALTFDDGPHINATNELLDLLRQLDVKATFFVVGKQVRKYPQLLKNIALAGHQVENHSFSHATMSKLTFEQAMTEYLACSLIIKDTIGTYPTYCRPPGGRANRGTLLAAAELQMKTAMWTCDPLDYAYPQLDVLQQRMKRGLAPGAIYLLHSGSKETMQILPRFVEDARRQGYRFVTVDEAYRSWAKPVVAKVPRKR